MNAPVMETVGQEKATVSIQDYLDAGWQLCQIPLGKKGPQHEGWNLPQNALQSPPEAQCNVGLLHSLSGTAALDLDDLPLAKAWLAERGIQLDDLLSAPDAVQIVSGRPGSAKLLYSLPFPLPSKKIIITVEGQRKVAFELRCATADGKSMQCVLPGSLHPSGTTYEWAGSGDWKALPALPDPLLNVWMELLKADEGKQSSRSTVPVSMAEVATALNACDPNCDRKTWIELGMAVHDAATAVDALEAGFRLWNDWSAKSESKYPGQRAVMAQWNSFKAKPENGITVASLFMHAADAGWERPAPDLSGMFGAVPQEQSEKQSPAYPKPLPIPNVLLPVEPFDYDLLPTALVDWVRDTADRMKCPPEYIAVVAMSILGALIARKVVLKPKKHDTKWVIIANLWTAMIGRSAMMKSPAMKAATVFLKMLEASARNDHAGKMKEWRRNDKFAEMEAAAMDKEAKKLLDSGRREEAKAKSDAAEAFRAEHAEPVEKRYSTNDATPEVLHQLYAENPQGILNIVDELMRWILDMGKQGREGSRQFHLESNDGDIEYTMDRIGRGKNMRATMCETVIGGMQPAKLFSHVKAANSGGEDDDGLIQRFSLMVWPDPVPFELVDRQPDAFAEAKARSVFQQFDSKPLIFDEDGRLRPVVVSFTDAAQGEFNDWYCRLRNELLNSDYLSPALISHLMKYSKAIPALAMIIGLAEGEEEVGTTSWRKAMGWYSFLRSHAERVYDYANKQLDELARTVVKKIQKRELGELKDFSPEVRLTVFKVRDVQRKVNALSDNANLVRDVLDLLVELKYLSDLSSFAGYGKDSYAVNPNVFE